MIPLAVAALLFAATSALAVTGQLTQLPGTAGCVADDTASLADACTTRVWLTDANRVAVTPDGRNAYVTSIPNPTGNYSGAITIFQRDATTGELRKPPGTGWCVGPRGCAVWRAVARPTGIAVSPDGKNVYVTTSRTEAVAVFRRDTTGKLTQLSGTAGCVSATGTGGACADGRHLAAPSSVVVSGDGASVYTVSSANDAVVVFRRDATTGELTQLTGAAGCITRVGAGCRVARAFHAPVSATVSPDGKNVYVASAGSHAVAVLRRNTTTGALFQPTATSGCVSETGSDPADPEATCADGKALESVGDVAVSADGKNVYLSSVLGTVAAFRRDAGTGALTQLAGTAGCVSERGSGGACSDGKALDGARSLAISADGRSVYLTTPGCSFPVPPAQCIDDAVAVFRRILTNGALTQLAGTAGCVSDTGSGGACADGKALSGATDVAVSADGESVYVASREDDAVAAFARETPP